MLLTFLDRGLDVSVGSTAVHMALNGEFVNKYNKFPKISNK